MGDIYHYDETSGKGIVYAGSVPIDDTQASEDTVYSSAKTEARIEEEINIVDEKIGNVSLYTSSNKYTKRIRVTNAQYTTNGVGAFGTNYGLNDLIRMMATLENPGYSVVPYPSSSGKVSARVYDNNGALATNVTLNINIMRFEDIS